MTNYGCDLVVQ